MNRRNLYSYHKYKNSRSTYRRASRYSYFNKQKRVRHYSEAVFPRFRTGSSVKFLNTALRKLFKWLVLPVLVILVVLFILLKSSYLSINQFSYEGLKSINQEEVDEFLKSQLAASKQSSFWPADNYFLINTNNLEEALNKKFPSAFSKIQLHFPHTLQVQMEEKDSTVIYYNGVKYYLLDHTGSILKPLTIMVNENIQTLATTATTSTSSTTQNLSVTTSTLTPIVTNEKLGKEYAGLPLIFDKRALEIKDQIISAELIKTIIKWKELVEKQKIATLSYFALENTNSGLEVFTNKTWKIYFNPQNDLFNQLNSLKLVLKENKPSEYIDLRYEGRVFWK